MSEKVWFVVENKHQVGPFTRSQIVDMINDGDLNGASEVRESGSAQRVSLSQNKDFSKFFQMPDLPSFESDIVLPELPQLPELPVEIETPPLLEEEIEEEVEDHTAPIELDNFVLEKEADKSEERASSIRSIASNPVFLFVCATFTVAALLYTFYVAQNFKHDILGPKNITVSKAKLMQQIASAPEGELEVLFALTRDKNAIWLATNLKGSHDIKVHFTSVENQILSDSDVEFSSETKSSGAYGEFKKMIFEKGTEIVPGEYDALLFVEASGLFNKVFNKKAHAPISKKVRVLLHPKENEDFLRDLKNYRDRQREANIRPLRERLEKYRTLLSMIQKTNTSYFKFLERALNGQSIADFEKEYIETISPLFQNIVLETNRKLIEYERVSHKDADRFKQIVEDYRAYGELVSDMVTMTGSKKWLRKKAKRELEETFRARVGELVQKTQAQINDLESRISQF